MNQCKKHIAKWIDLVLTLGGALQPSRWQFRLRNTGILTKHPVRQLAGERFRKTAPLANLALWPARMTVEPRVIVALAKE